MKKDRLDAFGIASLTAIAGLLAFNQIVIVWVNEGLQPVFFAGLRSALAVPFVLAWLALNRRWPRHTPGTARAGLLVGVVFSAEFLCLFMALDRTTVARAVVIFYTMPVWLALMAHFGLPGERLTPVRFGGLILAFGGTALAILDRGGGGQASLTGDLFALGAALGWAGTAYLTRASRLRELGPEVQLLWMVGISAPILLLAAQIPAFGPLVRAFEPHHILWLLFQAGIVVAGGFIAWLAILARYPAAQVASFSFLTPVISILFGWALLGQPLRPPILVAGALVAAGIVLVNQRRAPQPESKG